MTDHHPPSAHGPRQGMEHHSHFPRVYLIRHGETEWSLNGRHTGVSDIPLTPHGEEVMRNLGPHIVGHGKLLDPKHLGLIVVSPRLRTRKTFELLFEPLLENDKEHNEIITPGAVPEPPDPCAHRYKPSSLHPSNPCSHLHPVEVSEEVREWDYGDFEGRKSRDIRKGIYKKYITIM
jgi:sedoheptulose-bisphosphatase